MPVVPCQIRCVDYRSQSVAETIRQIRQALGPKGHVVSEAGRRRTIDVFGEPLTPEQVVERICGDVQSRGTAAVLEYSHKLDGATLRASDLRVPEAEMQAAHKSASRGFLETVRRVRQNIERFQSAILHQNTVVPLPGGGRLEQRYVPLNRVGLYFPGGAAAYPSTVLMTVVPARVAGVRQIAVASPPTPLGSYHPDLLATCWELGVTEVYRVGGAQAIAAFAYGLPELPLVDKICGPGNLFVALAKRHVYGQVAIDAIAGPSEVLVIADETSDTQELALDMIAQAEHSPGASILLTTSESLLARLPAAIEQALSRLERGPLAAACLEQFSAILLVESDAEIVRLANELAPEHLHICVAAPERFLPQLTTAGAVFVGRLAPVAVGDYAAGPSHVLPTGGTGRFSSGLSSNDFLRSFSVIAPTQADLDMLAPDIQVLAEKEGLTGHWASVAIRRKQ